MSEQLDRFYAEPWGNADEAMLQENMGHGMIGSYGILPIQTAQALADTLNIMLRQPQPEPQLDRLEKKLDWLHAWIERTGFGPGGGPWPGDHE